MDTNTHEYRRKYNRRFSPHVENFPFNRTLFEFVSIRVHSWFLLPVSASTLQPISPPSILRRLLHWAICGFFCAATAHGMHPAEERQKLLALFQSQGSAAVPALTDSLGHESESVRRLAAHLLVRIGESARSGMEAGLEHPDFKLRLIIVDGLARMGLLPEYHARLLLDDHPAIRRELQFLREMLDLPDAGRNAIGALIRDFEGAPPERRLHIVETLREMPFDESMRNLLVTAAADAAEEVRAAAYAALEPHVEHDWPEAADLLARATEDSDEAVRETGFNLRNRLLQVEELAPRLPVTGWRFRTDPEAVGREQAWYAPDHDDDAWRDDVPIEANWQHHMELPYNGTAWYRRTLDIPEIERWDEALLDFRGVDEEGWAWLNGQFVGSQELGSRGWDIPFQVDVTEALRPGAENQLTVKVRNTRNQGGIWQPVYLRILDRQRVINVDR